MYNINTPFVKNLAKNFMNKNYFCATRESGLLCKMHNTNYSFFIK